MKQIICARFVLTGALAFGAAAIAPAADTVPVTVDNFVRAESDLYFGTMVKRTAASAKFNHRREPASDRQADRHPPQPRHALFLRRVRPRCRRR